MAEEEGKNPVVWPKEANEASDFDFMMVGKNDDPIMKIKKEKLNEIIVIQGESMPAIQGGTTAAAAVALPAGPTAQNRWFDASWGYWKYNNVVLKNPFGTDGIPQGSDGMLYWDGTALTWKISKMQALASSTANGNIVKNNLEATSGDTVYTFMDSLFNEGYNYKDVSDNIDSNYSTYSSHANSSNPWKGISFARKVASNVSFDQLIIRADNGNLADSPIKIRVSVKSSIDFTGTGVVLQKDFTTLPSVKGRIVLDFDSKVNVTLGQYILVTIFCLSDKFSVFNVGYSTTDKGHDRLYLSNSDTLDAAGFPANYTRATSSTLNSLGLEIYLKTQFKGVNEINQIPTISSNVNVLNASVSEINSLNFFSDKTDNIGDSSNYYNIRQSSWVAIKAFRKITADTPLNQVVARVTQTTSNTSGKKIKVKIGYASAISAGESSSVIITTKEFTNLPIVNSRLTISFDTIIVPAGSFLFIAIALDTDLTNIFQFGYSSTNKGHGYVYLGSSLDSSGFPTAWTMTNASYNIWSNGLELYNISKLVEEVSKIESIEDSIESINDSLASTVDESYSLELLRSDFGLDNFDADDFIVNNWTYTKGLGFTSTVGANTLSDCVLVKRRYNIDNRLMRVRISPIASTVFRIFVRNSKNIENSSEGPAQLYQSCFDIDFAAKKINVISTSGSAIGTTVIASKDFTYTSINDFDIECILKGSVNTINLINKVSGEKFTLSVDNYTGAGVQKSCYSFYCTAGQCTIKNINVRTIAGVDIVIFGDSITEGHKVGIINSWSYKLRAFTKKNILISALSSTRMDQTLDKIDSELAIIKPKLVILLIGYNGFDAVVTKSQYDQFIAWADANGVSYMFCTYNMTTTGGHLGINNMIRSNYGSRLGAEFDYPTSVNGDLTTVVPGSLDADGYHPSIAGHELMFQRFLKDVTL